MNIFSLAGDTLRLVAIIALLSWILIRQSCAGISGKSQLLFALTYVTRYLDLFTNYISIYNSGNKAILILSTYTTLYLIFIQYKSTYNHKKDTFRIWVLLIPTAALALFFNHEYSLVEILWTFSIYLEPVAILPQLFMVAKIGRVEKVIVLYLLALWAYRALYIFNWIYRYYDEAFYDIIAIVAGCVQTMIYGKFFYHYCTRVMASAPPEGQEKNEKSAEAEGNPEPDQHHQMVLECWPGCVDSWLAPSYDSLDSSDSGEESVQPVKAVVIEPEKEGKDLKEVILPSTKM